MAKVKARVVRSAAKDQKGNADREAILAKRREYAAKARAKKREMREKVASKVKVALQPGIGRMMAAKEAVEQGEVSFAKQVKPTMGQALVDLVLACRQARVKSFKMEGIDIEFSQDYLGDRTDSVVQTDQDKPTTAYPAPVAMQSEEHPQQPSLFDKDTRELIRDNDLMISDPMGFEQEMINQVEAAEHGRTANGYDPGSEGAFY